MGEAVPMLLFLSFIFRTGVSVSLRARQLLLQEHRADTQGEVACLGLGCDRKQEVPVISQDSLTLEREPVKTGRPPRWGGKVWPGLENTWLPVALWVS